MDAKIVEKFNLHPWYIQNVMIEATRDVFRGKHPSDIIVETKFWLLNDEQRTFFKEFFCNWLANYNRARKMLGLV